jgi:hypothetical protein
MKKLILLVALLTMVAFVSGVMAQQKPAPAPAKPAGTAAPAPAPAPAAEKAAKPAKADKFTGTVEKVDEAAKAVVVKGKKDEKTIGIDDKTKITKGGKDMPFADLKKGMNVSVEYKKDGDKMVATAIKASAPKAAKAAPAEKKEKAAAPAEKKDKPAEKPAEAPKK